MPLYQFDSPESLIKKVEFRTHGKSQEAYIFAPEGAPAESLTEIPARLQLNGLSVLPDKVDGKHVLRVTDYENPSSLVDALRKAQVVSGDYIRISTANDHGQPKKSFKQMVKDNSVQASGLFYTIGNIALIASGIARKDFAEAATGGFFAIGDTLLMAYGRENKDDQVDRLVGRLRGYLKEEGVEIPAGTALTPDNLAKEGGVIEKTNQFLKDNRLAIKNAAEVAGGFSYFKAGLGQKNPYKSAAGLLIVTGFLTALLVEEKPKSEQKQADNGDKLAAALDADHHVRPGKSAEKQDDHEGPLLKVKHWVEERPLRVTGTMALTHNVLSTIGAFDERSRNPKIIGGFKEKIDAMNDAIKGLPQAQRDAYEAFVKSPAYNGKDMPKEHHVADVLYKERDLQTSLLEKKQKGINHFKYNLASVSAMVVANSLYAISSKSLKDATQDKALHDDLCAISASIVAAQPPAARDHLINRVAGFFAAQKEVHMTASEIAEQIHVCVDNLNKSPWLARIKSSKELATQAGMQV